MDGQPRPAPRLDESTARQRKDSVLRADTGRKLGIYVIRASSKEEAEKIASTDPYTEAGFCAFDVIEWEVHQILGNGPFTAAELRRHDERARDSASKRP